MTTRTCPHCHEERSIELFQVRRGRATGWCRFCRTECERQRRLTAGIEPKKVSRIENGKKLCLGCDCMKPLNEFSPSERGLGGAAAYCKPCFRAKFAPTPEKMRASTAKYRRENRERALALHRLHQFKRRSKIAVTDDGTVTDGFLKALYATSRCFYCEEETPVEQRTADHVLPLARGGAHSASNMQMACRSCNSAKRDLTEDQFRSVLNDDNHGKKRSSVAACDQRRHAAHLVTSLSEVVA